MWINIDKKIQAALYSSEQNLSDSQDLWDQVSDLILRPIMPKIGFAGFPNETKAYLGDKKNWRIWEFLGWEDYVNFDLDQSEEWKIINLSSELKLSIYRNLFYFRNSHIIFEI